MPTIIKNNTSNKISKMTTLLHSNRLKLNAPNQNLLYFFKHPKIIPQLNIMANGNSTEEVQAFNFLGITMVKTLLLTPHKWHIFEKCILKF